MGVRDRGHGSSRSSDRSRDRQVLPAACPGRSWRCRGRGGRASRWTIVSGTRLELDIVGRRREVRGPDVECRHLARRVELDAQPRAVVVHAARASGRRRGRRSPAGGCTGRTASVTVDAQRPTARRVAVGVGLDAARGRTRSALRARARPRGRSRRAAGRRRLRGISAVSSTGMPPSPSACRTCSCATAMPGPGRTVARTRSSRPSRSDVDEAGARVDRAPAPPSAPPCRRSGRCRSVPATAPAAGRPRERMDAAARRHPARLGVAADGRGGGAPAPASRPAAAPSRPRSRSAPRRRVGGREPDGQPSASLAGPDRRGRKPGRRPCALRPGRDRGQRQRHPPPTRVAVDGELPASPQPAEVAEVLPVLRRHAPARRGRRRRRDADRERPAACAPTWRASGAGPARPGRRGRSCRRWAASPKSPP